METVSINFLAVFVAALSAFVVGGLWYSPLLFGKAWQRLNQLEDAELGKSMGKVFGGAALLSLVMALNLAAFLGPQATLGFGVGAGAAAGIGWVAAGMGITYLFERKSFKLFAINAGYHVVTLTMMGAILGAWT